MGYKSSPGVSAGLLLVPLLIAYGTAMSDQGFDSGRVYKFHANREQVSAFVRGFDTEEQITRRPCVSASIKTTKSAGKPAESKFDYIRTAREIFEREDVDIGVSVSVQYLGSGGGVVQQLPVNFNSGNQAVSIPFLGGLHHDYRLMCA